MSQTERRIILDLCGGTGAWSRPYAEAGYDVRIVTLPEQDVRTYIPPMKVHGILAAPPCTVFSLAARVKRSESEIAAGLSIVQRCIEIVDLVQPRWWALENPRGRLVRYLGPPAYTFEPCWYGDPWRKPTSLWGDFTIPPRRNEVRPRWGMRHGPARKDRPVGSQLPCHPELNKVRGKIPGLKALDAARAEWRSITPPGFARAFFESNP